MLTRKESSALRGIAILGIVLHNYTHWLGPMVKENEYTFTQSNVNRLMVELAHPSSELLAHLLSFFGHYGVPVFLFLSAYGLVMKYEPAFVGKNAISEQDGTASETPSESVWTWIVAHWKKLFTMMAIGYGAFVMVDYMTPGPYRYTFWNVLGQLGMFSNLYADPDHAIWPGPYWFFGLMLQLYLIYRLLLFPRKGLLSSNLSLIIFTVLCVVGQCLMAPESSTLEWYRYNALGSMLPFACGLIYGRAVKSNGKSKSLIYAITSATTRSTQFGIIILCCLLIMIGSLNFYAWALVPAVVCVLHVIVAKVLPDRALDALSWVGGISAAMFVSHPIARKIIIPISRHGELYAGLLLYIVAAIVLGIVFREIIKRAK